MRRSRRVPARQAGLTIYRRSGKPPMTAMKLRITIPGFVNRRLGPLHDVGYPSSNARLANQLIIMLKCMLQMIQTESATMMKRITSVNTKLIRFQPPSEERLMCRKYTRCTTS